MINFRSLIVYVVIYLCFFCDFAFSKKPITKANERAKTVNMKFDEMTVERSNLGTGGTVFSLNKVRSGSKNKVLYSKDDNNSRKVQSLLKEIGDMP